MEKKEGGDEVSVHSHDFVLLQRFTIGYMLKDIAKWKSGCGSEK